MFDVLLPSGMNGQTCSYTAKFIADTVKDFKAMGVSEAKLQDGLVKGHWGVLTGKALDGTLKPGTVMLRGKGVMESSVFKDAEIRFSYAGNGQVKKQIFKNGNPVGQPVTLPMDSVEALYVENPVPGKWDMRLPTQKTPSVGSSSPSVGSMTDEDAAMMFVKTKDDFAKAKGINIKGANPQLDVEVFDSIAKVTGYSPKEIQAKVEAYKASGKKLSALKKKVMSGKAKVVTPEPVTPPKPPAPAVQPPIAAAEKKVGTSTPSPVNSTVAEAKPVSGYKIEKKTSQWTGDDYYETTLNGNKIGVVKPGTSPVSAPGSSYSYAQQKVWKATLYDGNGGVTGTFEYKTKQAAQVAVENWSKTPKIKALPEKVQPPKVHVEASKPAVQEAVKDLQAKDAQQALAYKDEDVVKAYIKAKDAVAGDTANTFTLYSKGDVFDTLIREEMKKAGVSLQQSAIDKHIADYLGSGQKLSVLKKKMIKSGELKPQADTLKATKAQQQFNTPATTSAKAAEQQVKGMAEAKVDPVGSTPFSMDAATKQDIFDSLKNSIYAGGQNTSLYEQFAKKAAELTVTKGEKVSVLDVIRAYDELKAKQLNLTNGFFYEQKVATWAASPEGRTQILLKQEQAAKAAEAQAKALKDAAEKKAKEQQLEALINKDIPELPPDSVNYQTISRDQAVRDQNQRAPWNANEKANLRHYTGGSYRDMNKYLRGQTSYVSETNRTAINYAQDGMRPIEKEVLTKRGAGYDSFGIGDGNSWGFNNVDHMKFKELVGKEITDEGFLSTSVGSHSAFSGSVQIHVEITPGTHAAFVDHISMHPGENEMLIARGTRYKVLRVTKENGKTVVRLRTIPGSHSTKRH